MANHPQNLNKPITLGIDIGGTAIKMMLIDANAAALSEYLREPTPHPATKNAVCELIVKMMQRLPPIFDRVSAGFPGVVQNGVIKTAPNMHVSWIDIALDEELQKITEKPSRAANDADVQGFGDITGKGVELVITLGTGVGSALFLDGKLVPNLELGHHPFEDNKTYEEILGKAALLKDGDKTWQKNLKKAIALWEKTFNYDKLFLGGGYAYKINFTLPNTAQISDNVEGVIGGIKLWQ